MSLKFKQAPDGSWIGYRDDPGKIEREEKKPIKPKKQPEDEESSS